MRRHLPRRPLPTRRILSADAYAPDREAPPAEPIEEAAFQHEPDDDTRDAERWRALIRGTRMRVITDAVQPHSSVPKDARYIMVDMWTGDEMPTLHIHMAKFIDYIDRIRTSKGNRNR